MGIPTFNSLLQFGTGMAKQRQAEEDGRAALRAKAELLDAQAARKERDAEDALRIGFLDQADQVREGRADLAGKRVAYAASGVKVDAGSALAVVADGAAWNEHGRQRIACDADRKSWGLDYDAALLRAEASAARAGVRV